MVIYTKTGDDGTTSLFGGKRLLKSDLQVEVYGSIDELTSFIGLVASKMKDKKDLNFLTELQKDLYIIMSFLSGKEIDLKFLDEKVKIFENKIDVLENKLPKLHRFILPGGAEISSWFHVLRAICRRAERLIVKPQTKRYSLHIIRYFNRLSDLFFVFARFYNREKEVVV